MEIEKQCRSRGFFLHPEAREKLEDREDANKIIDEVIGTLSPDKTVIRPKHIDEASKKEKTKEMNKTQVNSLDSDLTLNFEIEKDITDKSCCKGELEDFVEYFNEKFEKISGELRKRNGISQARPIESLNNFNGETSVIGIVNEKRSTSKGHVLVELEDKTGKIPALALKNNEEVLKETEKILLDEVIGVKGRISKESDLLIIKEIIWPDLPIRNEVNKANKNIYAAFISDLHFGSESFLQEPWNRFVRWLNGDVGNSKQRELVKKVKYLVIAGDIVEGVGVYPDQKEELAIEGIEEQYKKASDELSKIRDDIEIFLSPGNHDAVRQAEPQPALSKKMKDIFSQKRNIHFIGNPSVINLDGVKVLVYHGRSLDDLVTELPDKKYEEPANLMKEYIKRRHLVPSYGKNTPVAPEENDHLFVKDPDIIHCGHIHTMGIDRYRGVSLFNTGTWQGQTKFQLKKGIEPTPGRAVLLNLKNHSPKILRFYE